MCTGISVVHEHFSAPQLTPAAVFVLLRQQEIAGIQNWQRSRALSNHHQSFDSEPSAVGQAASPRTIPATIVSLDGQEELAAAVHGSAYFAGSILREASVESGLNNRNKNVQQPTETSVSDAWRWSTNSSETTIHSPARPSMHMSTPRSSSQS